MQICEGVYSNADKTLEAILTEKVREKVTKATKDCCKPDKSCKKPHNKKKLAKESSHSSKNKIRMKMSKNDGEYVVKVYIDDKFSEKDTYYTNDKDDAVATMTDMKKRFINKGHVVEESVISEGLSEKGVKTVEKWISEHGHRGAAEKLIDYILTRRIGLTSSDLPDTSTFASGLDAIEESLEENDFVGAFQIAKDTATEMIEDEGGF